MIFSKVIGFPWFSLHSFLLLPINWVWKSTMINWIFFLLCKKLNLEIYNDELDISCHAKIKISFSPESFLITSCHQRCSVKKNVLGNFMKFTGQSLFFDKAAALRPATLSKKRLRHRCFPMTFAKFLRTPFLQNTSRRLLLKDLSLLFSL